MKLPLTPTPTKVYHDMDAGDGVKFDSYTIELYDPTERRIAVIAGYSNRQYPGLSTQEEVEEAARYIERAVNMHAELVAALESALLVMESCAKTHGYDTEIGVVPNARAILAKANGEAPKPDRFDIADGTMLSAGLIGNMMQDTKAKGEA